MTLQLENTNFSTTSLAVFPSTQELFLLHSKLVGYRQGIQLGAKRIDDLLQVRRVYEGKKLQMIKKSQQSYYHLLPNKRKFILDFILINSTKEKFSIQSLIMQQRQILELIEAVVKPLREKIQHLEKQNQMIKTQLNIYMRPSIEIKRGRSKSKQQKDAVRKEQYREVKSPSLKKKDEKGDKPVWNYAKPSAVQVKSPPKEKYIAPRPNPRPSSKQKLDTEKTPSEKKITGGKRFDQLSNANSNQGKTPQNQISSHHGEQHQQ